MDVTGILDAVKDAAAWAGRFIGFILNDRGDVRFAFVVLMSLAVAATTMFVLLAKERTLRPLIMSRKMRVISGIATLASIACIVTWNAAFGLMLGVSAAALAFGMIYADAERATLNVQRRSRITTSN